MLRSQFDDTGWPEQWARVQRRHRRLAQIRAAPPAKGAPGEPEALDDVLAFFGDCFHLADWLKNDRVDPHPEARKFVHETEVLLICRDLANGTKHCVLDSRWPASTYPNMTTTAQTIAGSPAQARWLVEVEPGDRRDLFDLADQCVKAWRSFIDGLEGGPPAPLV
jgi:hypothetical protein